MLLPLNSFHVQQQKSWALQKGKNLIKKNLSLWIQNLLIDKKALDVQSIDVRHRTHLADFFILASGTSSRHIVALAEHLVTSLKSEKIKANLEGHSGSPWILVDAGSIVVHLFHPETRTLYNFENLWNTSHQA